MFEKDFRPDNDSQLQENKFSLQEAVSKFNVLKAADILQMDTFQRQQDLKVTWLKPDDCYLLLFISHRWESPDHPDPTGKQLAALKTLIHLICDATRALTSENNEERLKALPTLRNYGVLQALLLISRLSSSVSSIKYQSLTPENLPEHIGIWYDFSCLPQKPRTITQEKEFAKALLNMPDLLDSNEISLIALREKNDDYENRGWCFAEAYLATNEEAFTPLTLRIDRLGTTIKSPDFSTMMKKENKLPLKLHIALTAWEDIESKTISPDKSWETIVLLTSFLSDSSLNLGDDTPVLQLIKKENPGALWTGILFVRILLNKNKIFDFSDLLLEFLKEKGLQCSEDNDLIYVGLLALHSINANGSRMHHFFQECLNRHVRNKGLLMQVSMFTETSKQTGKNKKGISTDDFRWKFIDGR